MEGKNVARFHSTFDPAMEGKIAAKLRCVIHEFVTPVTQLRDPEQSTPDAFSRTRTSHIPNHAEFLVLRDTTDGSKRRKRAMTPTMYLTSLSTYIRSHHAQ